MASAPDTIFGYPKYPPYKAGQPRFPQDTFVGRWLHFLDIIDPRTLLTSQAKLASCIELLEEHKQHPERSEASDQQLWQAQRIKQAIVHPDTGENILPPFRMSGFVPFGWITVVGLLLPNHSLATMTFWQWINQTHNACVNYANRNASEATPLSRFAQGYVGAVGTSVGLAIGLQVLVNKAQHFKPITRMIVQRFIPLPAVSLASSCNVILMRRHELDQGIKVYDEHDQCVGTSQNAAKQALTETTMTRALLPVPLLTIPPVIMLALERTRFLKRHPRLHLPLNSVIVVGTFACALPLTIALFPQISYMKREDLESELQAKTTCKLLHYNKGL